jgi:hypothetical protein
MGKPKTCKHDSLLTVHNRTIDQGKEIEELRKRLEAVENWREEMQNAADLEEMQKPQPPKCPKVYRETHGRELPECHQCEMMVNKGYYGKCDLCGAWILPDEHPAPTLRVLIGAPGQEKCEACDV